MSLAIETQGAAIKRFPLWSTIRLSYSTYFANFKDVLRISWLWLIVVPPLSGIVMALQASWMTDLVANMKSGAGPRSLVDARITLLVLQFANYLLLTLALTSIAVAWHRRILLNEQPGLSGGNIVSSHVWRYFGIGLVICLIAVLPILAIYVPAYFLTSGFKPQAPGTMPPGAALLIPLFLIAYIFTAVLMLRLSLLLPARAVGDTGLTIKQTWIQTRHNTWRINWGFAACIAPPLTIVLILSSGLLAISGIDELGENLAWTAGLNSAIYMGAYLLTAPIVIGFMSHVYRDLFQRT